MSNIQRTSLNNPEEDSRLWDWTCPYCGSVNGYDDGAGTLQICGCGERVAVDTYNPAKHAGYEEEE
jgi:hypothetical protein